MHRTIARLAIEWSCKRVRVICINRGWIASIFRIETIKSLGIVAGIPLASTTTAAVVSYSHGILGVHLAAVLDAGQATALS